MVTRINVPNIEALIGNILTAVDGTIPYPIDAEIQFYMDLPRDTIPNYKTEVGIEKVWSKIQDAVPDVSVVLEVCSEDFVRVIMYPHIISR